ncbi:dehydration-responsive protein RD22-like [Populus alba x Populus x berolinensis]|uniref:Dehydration-responsive protein RD22-like n=1 Tax=Populus alba x Populus x berolinensis TaxID=444605 RepID=A0AAD6W7V3_9ROSI|nr:dehydration-responsive protein RD22-like [Populus alba x Populus x berolinensis]
MKLLFTNSGTKVSFLPRRVAESIPFSSDKFPEILNYFSLQVNSKEAEIISEEIGYCESPNLEGEEKYCAASLESLIDFNVARLGQNVEVLSTEPGKKQEYTAWSPDHMAFEVLNIKPGPAVCHFLATDTLVWVPKKDQDMTP